ncbi:MAG TPA: ATP-dependent helicase C-terminal domain-containing protein, partial [Nevskiaceae bacterium]|nr:ATP-dependent helicase C-terminal domain-containing protein [Nevskiaceae bacterium]
EAQSKGALEPAAWVAAALDERVAEGGTDLAERVERLRQGRGDPAQLRRVRDAVRQFVQLLARDRERGRDAAPADAEGADVARLVALAFPERLARRREGLREAGRQQREVAYLCVDGGEARLAEHDPLARAEWLAIAHWDPGPQRRIRLAAAIDERAVRDDHASHIARVRNVRWDAPSETVIAAEEERLGAIVLQSRRLEKPGDDARQAMIEGIRAMGLGVLPWSESTAQWRARVASLRAWQPEGGWPDVSDEALLATLDDWLAPWLDGVTRRAHLSSLDLAGILNAMLDHDAQRRLARLAPTQLMVPSGQSRPLRYEPPGPPALEVKLQEMFGARDTPAVCDGRIKVVLHLLSPAQRPVAVTQDLARFWTGGYLEVRKDLRGRYPKHPWPEDPLGAAPTHRAKPRGT